MDELENIMLIKIGQTHKVKYYIFVFTCGTYREMDEICIYAIVTMTLMTFKNRYDIMKKINCVSLVLKAWASINYHQAGMSRVF